MHGCLVSLTRLDFLQIEMKYALYNDYYIHWDIGLYTHNFNETFENTGIGKCWW